MSSDFSGFDQSAAESSRVYRTSKGGRIFFAVLGAALTSGALAGISYFRSIQDAGTSFIEFLCFPLLLFGAYVVMLAIRSKIVLYADAIEQHGAISVKRLMRHEIEGLRRAKMP